MKSLRPIVSFLSLLSAILPCTAQANGPDSRIGVSAPFSGPVALYGEEFRKVLEFANRHEAGGKYQFIFEDDKCSGKDAVTVAHKFVSIDQIKVVVGFACSGALLSAAPIYESNHVLAIGITATSPKLSKAGRYIFRTVSSDSQAAKLLADSVAEKSGTIGVLSEETEYCEDMLSEFSKNIPGKIATERFQAGGGADFRAMLLRLRNKGVTALFLNPQSEAPLIEMVKVIRSLRWEVPLYAVYFASSPSFLEAVGEKADGIRFVNVPLVEDFDNPELSRLYGKFSVEHGPLKGVEYSFVSAYNAFIAATKVLSSDDPVRALEGHELRSEAGSFRFDADGDARGIPLVKQQIVKGKVAAW